MQMGLNWWMTLTFVKEVQVTTDRFRQLNSINKMVKSGKRKLHTI